MTAYSTIVRATHVLTNAAWFGGSLAGAVALNPASRKGDRTRANEPRSPTRDGGGGARCRGPRSGSTC